MHGLNRMQILIISPEPWNGHFVSKHHYAVTLSQEGYDVYFLNPPVHPLKEINIQKTKYENLWEVSAPQVAKGLRFYPKILRNYVEKKWLEGLEKHIGKKFTTIWLFENSRFYDMDFAGERTKIYHQVDLNQNFHVKIASKTADICFCTTNYIMDEISLYTKKIYKIHHGVELVKNSLELSEIQQSYFKKKSIHIVYIGNLDMKYLDVDLLVNVVEKYENIQFHFIGGYTNETPLYQQLKEKQNICWWGKIESERISTVLNLCDVLLVSYQTRYFVDQASPHKMMEYFASGKVAVSTYTDEYKDKRELLEMVDASSEYLERFDEVVNDLAFYNSNEKQKMRRTFSKEHSYEKQLEKIEEYLKEYHLSL